MKTLEELLPKGFKFGDMLTEGILRAILINYTESYPMQTSDEQTLRKLLACSYSGSNLYGDDGELQDASHFPIIDFVRDSVVEIEKKIHNRATTAYQKLLTDRFIAQQTQDFKSINGIELVASNFRMENLKLSDDKDHFSVEISNEFGEHKIGVTFISDEYQLEKKLGRKVVILGAGTRGITLAAQLFKEDPTDKGVHAMTLADQGYITAEINRDIKPFAPWNKRIRNKFGGIKKGKK